MKRSTLIHLSLIALCSLCCAVSSMAQSYINHGSLCRVFFIKYGEATATAFTIEVHDEQFLVTAKHAVPNITKGAEISVFNRIDWLKLKVTPSLPSNRAPASYNRMKRSRWASLHSSHGVVRLWWIAFACVMYNNCVTISLQLSS